MRMKSLILIFIALGCGLVASIGISQVMNQGGGAGNMEMEQVLVALADIDIGAKLDAQNVKLEDWPKAKIPEGAVRRLEDVKDKFANARFFKGEPLHVNKISDTLSNIANKVPPGYRAMPVKVDEDTVMKGISPGDRVDVMVFLKRNGQDITETGAFTILKNVRVFAVASNTERASEGKGETANFKTISLLVKPDHSRELAVAAMMGKIMLTLRRPDENDEVTGEEVTPLAEILSGRSKLGSETKPVSTPAPPSFLGLVQETVNGGNSATTAAPTTVEPVWTMDILTPTERKRFEWTDLKQPPTETNFASAGTSPSPAPAPSGKAPKTTDKDNSDKGASFGGDESKPPPDKDSK